MAAHATKHLGKSDKFKYVYKVSNRTGQIEYSATITINRVRFNSRHKTERAAAIAVDRYLLENHKQPINILIPKK